MTEQEQNDQEQLEYILQWTVRKESHELLVHDLWESWKSAVLIHHDFRTGIKVFWKLLAAIAKNQYYR